VLDLVHEPAFGRLRRHLNDVALHVDFPAVIETAQSALLVAAKRQRHAAMRAVFVEHAQAALGVAEHDEVFAE
jgi:hypothetical protein